MQESVVSRPHRRREISRPPIARQASTPYYRQAPGTLHHPVRNDELPKGQRKGDTKTLRTEVMKLSGNDHHTPFLAAADMQIDPIQKIEAYRKTIRVDYACELAHQQASQVARDLARQRINAK